MPRKQAGQMTAMQNDQYHKENSCKSGAVHKWQYRKHVLGIKLKLSDSSSER